MASLTHNYDRPRKASPPQQANTYPAKAGTEYFTGQYLCIDVTANVGVPGADAFGSDGLTKLRPAGVLVKKTFSEDTGLGNTHHLDNRNGADGAIVALGRPPANFERCVRFDRVGEFAFETMGAPVCGGRAYLVDDSKVSANPADTARAIVVGRFTRPADWPGQWFVDIAKREE